MFLLFKHPAALGGQAVATTPPPESESAGSQTASGWLAGAESRKAA